MKFGAQSQVGRGLAALNRASVIDRRQRRCMARAARTLGPLLVESRLVCQRWQGVCDGHYAVDFITQRTAVLVAARDAFAARLGRGVALRDITVEPTERDGQFSARLSEMKGGRS